MSSAGLLTGLRIRRSSDRTGICDDNAGRVVFQRLISVADRRYLGSSQAA
jgi:hypothetical protein